MYKLGFEATEVSEFGTGKKVEGLIRIGDRLKMEINMVNPFNSVKTSPQNCYATRLNGTGRFDFIRNRYVYVTSFPFAASRIVQSYLLPSKKIDRTDRVITSCFYGLPTLFEFFYSTFSSNIY